MKKLLLILLLLTLNNIYAKTLFTSTGSGNWTTSFSSVGTGNPKIYYIRYGDNITLNTNVVLDSLYIKGTLTFGNSKQFTGYPNIILYGSGIITGGNTSSGWDFDSGNDIYGTFNGVKKIVGYKYANYTTKGFISFILSTNFDYLNIYNDSIIWNINAERYQLEYSKDLYKFSMLYETTKNNSYKLTLEGYYRLKVFYTDSDFSYSNVVYYKNKQEEINIYPNPSDGNIIIINDNIEPVKLQIYTSDGKLVKTILYTELITYLNLTDLDSKSKSFFVIYSNRIIKLIIL